MIHRQRYFKFCISHSLSCSDGEILRYHEYKMFKMARLYYSFFFIGFLNKGPKHFFDIPHTFPKPNPNTMLPKCRKMCF